MRVLLLSLTDGVKIKIDGNVKVILRFCARCSHASFVEKQTCLCIKIGISSTAIFVAIANNTLYGSK